MEEDASGLTFEEWDPTNDADAEQPPVAMLVNSSEVRAAGFKLIRKCFHRSSKPRRAAAGAHAARGCAS